MANTPGCLSKNSSFVSGSYSACFDAFSPIQASLESGTTRSVLKYVSWRFPPTLIITRSFLEVDLEALESDLCSWIPSSFIINSSFNLVSGPFNTLNESCVVITSHWLAGVYHRSMLLYQTPLLTFVRFLIYTAKSGTCLQKSPSRY